MSQDQNHDAKDKTHGHGLVGHGQGSPAQGHSGETADMAADRIDDAEGLKGKERQEVLMDEAVEESFPASDPPSPKHIT